MRRSFLLLLIIPAFFLQGCGLAGAYIWFGDRNLNVYNQALASGDKEQMAYALNQALGCYTDSLTYDELRYPLVYVKLAETAFKIKPDSPGGALSWAELGISRLKGEYESSQDFKRLSEIAEVYAAAGRFMYIQHRDPWNQAKIAEAKDLYRAALLKRGSEPRFNAGLASIMFHEIEKNNLEAAQHLNGMLFSGIEDLIEAGLNISNPSPYILESQALFAYFKEDYSTAIQKFTEIMQSTADFDRRRANLYLVKAYTATRRFQEATQISQTYLDVNPTDYEFLAERCIANFSKGDSSSGNLDLAELEKNRPEYHEFYYRLGKVLSEGNQANRAEIFLLKAYRERPEIGHYAYALGRNYLLKGEKNVAKQFFSKAQTLAPAGSGLEKDAKHSLSEL